jgi:hypothetical protein
MTDEKLALDAQRAENKAIEELNDRFKASIRQTVAETDWGAIERRLLAQIQADEVANAISWQGYNPSDLLGEAFSAASEISAANIADVVAKGSSLSFELTDPNALKWLEKYGADEIKYLSDSQRDAIKKIVVDGYRDGITYQQQARQIRDSIGLDPRRAEVLQKYSDNLFSKGKSEAEVWRLMEKKGKALLNQRARNIAVQEATTAGARGFYETTLDACNRGILDPNIYEAYRIVTGDERLCSKCSGLMGEARPLPDRPYQSSGDVTPKLHHLCRCVEGVRGVGGVTRQKLPTKKTAPKTYLDPDAPTRPVDLTIPGTPKKRATKPEPIEMVKKKNIKESGRTKIDVIFEAKALKRKDGVIYCPTVPLVEGVFSGLGIPVLRLYEEFSKDAKWLQGLTVLTNHDDLSPSSRRIGQLVEPRPRPDTKDIAATTQFYEIDLTQREIENITSQKPIHGSLSLSYNLENVAGDYSGVHYEAIERGPYVFYEYSMVREGVVTPTDGAGFNMECKGCQSKSHSRSSAPGGADMEIEEMKQAIDEAVTPLTEKLATLEQKNTALEGELKTIREKAEATKEAEQKALFVGKLKAGHLEKAEEHWQECKKVGYLAFEAAHTEMIIVPAQERKLKGSAMAGEGGSGQPRTIEEANAAHQKKMSEVI